MRKLIVLIVLVAACSIEKRGAPGTDRDTEVVLGEQRQTDSVEVIIATPSFAVTGDEVPISVVVRNNTDRRMDLHLTGREVVFDIVVTRPDSSVVWQRLAHTTGQQILQLRPMAPRESFTLSDHWHATEPGEYLVTASLPTDAAPLQAQPVRLTIR
jgi:hypothetical protein